MSLDPGSTSISAGCYHTQPHQGKALHLIVQEEVTSLSQSSGYGYSWRANLNWLTRSDTRWIRRLYINRSKKGSTSRASEMAFRQTEDTSLLQFSGYGYSRRAT